MPSTYLLLVSAAIVGIVHMSAPDHWVTLTVLSQNLKWSKAKLMAYTFITGIGHSVTSIVLGLAIVFFGFLFSRHVTFYITKAVGVLMLVVGLYVGIRNLLRKEHIGGDQLAKKDKGDIVNSDRLEEESTAKSIGYMAILGAAMSPDLSVLPIFLIAVPVGIGAAFYISIVFAMASIATVIILVWVSSTGLSKALEKIPPKYNDSLVGFVIAAVGLYVMIAG